MQLMMKEKILLAKEDLEVLRIVNLVVFKLPCQGKKILSRIFAPVNLFQKSNMVVAEEKCFLSGVVEGKNLMSLFSTYSIGSLGHHRAILEKRQPGGT